MKRVLIVGNQDKFRVDIGESVAVVSRFADGWTVRIAGDGKRGLTLREALNICETIRRKRKVGWQCSFK